MIRQNNLRETLISLGFDEAGVDRYDRYFPFADCHVIVDFATESIIYPKHLKYERSTTLNFSQAENFVVLDCVCRLLALGYKPEHLHLEAGVPGGHDDNKAGYADILVSDNDENEYMIIECKTTEQTDNDEFALAWNKVKKTGGQLFNYFNTYRKARYLILYAADYTEKGAVPLYHVITLLDNEEYLRSNKKLQSYASVRAENGGHYEYFSVWKETYQQDYSTNGVFEKNIAPFQVGNKKLAITDLLEIDSVSMQKKYNEYATILRKYNVSSKENAFDKLINLFLAKIIDEKYNASELRCYWKGAAYDNYFDLHDRLHELYKTGMEEFFDDKITYVENREVEAAFRFLKSKTDVAKETILNYFRELKYFNNNPFAILDVHNEELFNQNAIILKEVVRMVQDIKLGSDKQNQFLGDLFEGFLDQGIKQSEGQFFTPIPIVRFLISALPLEQLIKEENQIPKVIDYACGAGHFLTEYASQIRTYVEKTGDTDIHTYYENIIGIEKEYRLSKVAQVSAYMYGQDGIQIRYNDALSQDISDVKNGTYSILIANPPYSVKGFLETLSGDDLSAYELTRNVSDRSKNNAIETFFVERAKQLLKGGGIAAIILPSSILNKGGVYAVCREIILQYFHIVAIACFGSGTFGKTGTNTVTLFLERREEKPSLAEHCKNRVESWFSGNFEDDGVYQDHALLEDYCSVIDVELEQYQAFLCGEGDDFLRVPYFNAYVEVFEADKKNLSGLSDEARKIRQKYKEAKKKKFKQLSDEEQEEQKSELLLSFIRVIEQEKLYFYLLARNNHRDVVVVNAPVDNKEQKAFLGYEWSASKGREGIKYLGNRAASAVDNLDDDVIEKLKGVEGIVTPLFDPQNLESREKLNTIIRENFIGTLDDIPEELSAYVHIISLADMIDFRAVGFDKGIKTAGSAIREFISIQSDKFESDTVGNLCAINPSKQEIENISRDTKVSFIDMASLSDEGYIERRDERFLSEVENGSYKYFRENDFILAKITPCMENGKCAIATGLKNGIGFGSSEYHVFRCGDRILPQYLYYLVNREEIRLEAVKHMTGASGHRRVPVDFYEKMRIPVPPISVQKEMVRDFEKYVQSIREEENRLRVLDEQVKSRFVEMFGEVTNNPRYNGVKLGLICNTVSGGTPDTKNHEYYQGKVPWITTVALGKLYVGSEDANNYITEEAIEHSATHLLPRNTLIFGMRVGVGKSSITKVSMCTNQDIVGLVDIDENLYHKVYLKYVLDAHSQYFDKIKRGMTIKGISSNDLKSIVIPQASLSLQNEFVAYVESVDKLRFDTEEKIKELKKEKEQLIDKYFR